MPAPTRVPDNVNCAAVWVVWKSASTAGKDDRYMSAVTTIVPVIHERIAKCTMPGLVERLVPGAQLVVTLDGTEYSAVASGASVERATADVRYAAAAGLCPMRTIRIPLDAFTAANPLFGPGVIQGISFGLNARPTGRIFIDDRRETQGRRAWIRIDKATASPASTQGVYDVDITGVNLHMAVVPPWGHVRRLMDMPRRREIGVS